MRLRPQHRNHVWSYDFVEAQTYDGRRLRLMTLIDEFTRSAWRSGGPPDQELRRDGDGG